MGEQFTKLPRDVLARTDLSSTAKLVYSIIVDRVGRNGHSWPGIRRIALDTGTTPKPVLKAIAKLESAGLLEVERGHGRSNRYRPVRPVSVGEAPAMEKGHQSRKSNAGVGEDPPQVVENLPPNQTQSDPLNQTHLAASPDDPTGHVVDGVRYGLFDDQGAQLLNGGGKASRPKGNPGPDPIWDALVELFNIKNPTKAERSRIGRVAADLRAKNATPGEVQSVYRRCKAEWDGKAFSPEALAKWFGQFRDGATGTGSPARIRDSSGRYGRVATQIVGIVGPEQLDKDHSAGH